MCPENISFQKNKDYNSKSIQNSLISNITKIKEFLGNSSDLVIQQLTFLQHQLAFLYISGLVDEKDIKSVLKAVKMENTYLKQKSVELDTMETLKDIISVGDTKELIDIEQTIKSLLSGYLVVLGDGWDCALVLSVAGGNVRDVSPPQSQTVIRGPKDSFTESIQTNQALIRRRLKSPNLHVKSLQIGNISKYCLSYSCYFSIWRNDCLYHDISIFK
ncbi:spore germination protein [Shimazuella sp. AN120528]|uniref:spore germination protein n=1 Tax=Shimazuella soli TaxID=1892854 RepID=UPI001F0D85B8|nr:spore germination protein [Shimazuella soli]MCH5585979.1 spore germination protein [Shimazuella soli]